MVRDDKGNWKGSALDCSKEVVTFLSEIYGKYVGELTYEDVFYIISNASETVLLRDVVRKRVAVNG